MINPSEIRIGNIILVPLNGGHVYAAVESWGTDGGYIRYINSLYGGIQASPSLRDLNPVVLDANILSSCSFISNSLNNAITNPVGFVFQNSVVYALVSNAPINRSHPIGHLHHLQNFYYALTGQELPVNL